MQNCKEKYGKRGEKVNGKSHIFQLQVKSKHEYIFGSRVEGRVIYEYVKIVGTVLEVIDAKQFMFEWMMG